jgi:hypothetical protein
MKKILVLLLVLATAAGLFALDGEWSLNGYATIGTIVDFTADPIPATGTFYFRPYSGWGGLHGELTAAYTLDALKLAINAATLNSSDGLTGDLQYDGGTFKFQVKTTNLASGMPDLGVSRLWGYYNMLSGLIHLEAAYNSADNGDGLWVSNKVGVFGDSNFRLKNPLNTVWPGGDTFTHFDHANYLLTSVELENLSFGVVLPNIFTDAGAQLLEDVMKEATAGFKFTMQPIEVAGQFQMGTFGTYIGLKWEFTPTLSAGLSFMGIFNDKATGSGEKEMKFGGGFTFAPDAFGFTVNGFYGAILNDQGSTIGIEPSFFYNVIPTHLRFQTDVGFYFAKANKNANMDVIWAIQPQIFWNFLGTGATGDFWGLSTGIIVRYRLVSSPAENNALDVTFKWSF